jgi:hypothetical protein
LFKKQHSLLAGLIFSARDLKVWQAKADAASFNIKASVASAIIPIVNFLLQLFTIYYR